jgi:hypothetical protein
MAIVNGVFIYGLPEDKDTNYLKVWECSTEVGTYTQATLLPYAYAARASEYDSLDTEKWYKIQFYNSSTALSGPLSDPVYGGDYDKAKPFVAISTSFDGAGYATLGELYEISKLTSTDVDNTNVRRAMKLSRAYIDILLDSASITRYSSMFCTDVARRKYNAQLEILKRAEIFYALALIYKNMADDEIVRKIREQKKKFQSISIGQTSLSQQESDSDISIAEFLDTQAQRYNVQANGLLQTIMPASVPVSYGASSFGRFRFVHPGDLYSWSGTISSSTGTGADFQTETLTGSGGSMNDTWYDITATLVDVSSILSDSYLIVNGVQYNLDSYILTTGVETGSGDSGFSLDAAGKIRWNYTTANGGFDLTDSDVIQLKYWTV